MRSHQAARATAAAHDKDISIAHVGSGAYLEHAIVEEGVHAVVIVLGDDTTSDFWWRGRRSWTGHAFDLGVADDHDAGGPVGGVLARVGLGTTAAAVARVIASKRIVDVVIRATRCVSHATACAERVRLATSANRVLAAAAAPAASTTRAAAATASVSTAVARALAERASTIAAIPCGTIHADLSAEARRAELRATTSRTAVPAREAVMTLVSSATAASIPRHAVEVRVAAILSVAARVIVSAAAT